MYGMSSSQSAGAYAGGFEGLSNLPIDESGRKVGPNIKQVHADFGADIDRARQDKLPNSAFTDIKDHLQALDEDKLKYILRALQDSRSNCCTLCEFHQYGYHVFRQISAWGLQWVVTYLKTNFFFLLKVEDSKEQYGLEQPYGATEGVLCAAWWCGYQRLQPGSGCRGWMGARTYESTPPS